MRYTIFQANLSQSNCTKQMVHARVESEDKLCSYSKGFIDEWFALMLYHEIGFCIIFSYCNVMTAWHEKRFPYYCVCVCVCVGMRSLYVTFRVIAQTFELQVIWVTLMPMKRHGNASSV